MQKTMTNKHNKTNKHDKTNESKKNINIDTESCDTVNNNTDDNCMDNKETNNKMKTTKRKKNNNNNENEVNKILTILFENLSINKIPLNSETAMFLTNDISKSQQDAILLLKPECKKWFDIYNWPAFSGVTIKTEWLSLVKSILKTCNYSVRSMTVNCGGRNVEHGFIIKKN